MKKLDKLKIIVSDCHLSAGRFLEGRINPYEDFLFDDELCDLLEHFTTGDYEKDSRGEPLETELILAGDFLDQLNVPYKGEFETEITEEMAVYKTEAILRGHPKVNQAFRRFAALPNHRITYLIGNHDADLVFAGVREAIIRAWDPEGRFPSDVVRVVHDSDRLPYPELGVEVRHGNNLDPGNEIDLQNPFRELKNGSKLLSLPWSSFYVLKIVNRLKREREYLDKIRPVRAFVLMGLLIDPLFTLKFVFLSTYYFIKTRLSSEWRRKYSFAKLLESLRKESRLFRDLEQEAREVLDRDERVKTVIFGHTHRPMEKIYADGRQYINTGTWTRMINLDWSGWGQEFRRTFALVRVHEDGTTHCELRQWVGEHSPHKIFTM